MVCYRLRPSTYLLRDGPIDHFSQKEVTQDVPLYSISVHSVMQFFFVNLSVRVCCNMISTFSKFWDIFISHSDYLGKEIETFRTIKPDWSEGSVYHQSWPLFSGVSCFPLMSYQEVWAKHFVAALLDFWLQTDQISIFKGLMGFDNIAFCTMNDRAVIIKPVRGSIKWSIWFDTSLVYSEVYFIIYFMFPTSHF